MSTEAKYLVFETCFRRADGGGLPLVDCPRLTLDEAKKVAASLPGSVIFPEPLPPEPKVYEVRGMKYRMMDGTLQVSHNGGSYWETSTHSSENPADLRTIADCMEGK
jgi:hypothetical protein